MRNFAISLPVLALAATVLAQAQATGKVGVINIQSAIVSTKDGQKAAADLEAKSAPKRKVLETKQTDINTMKDQLQKGQNALSETAKSELRGNIDGKTKSFNRDMEDAQAEFEQEQQKILQELGGRMMAVIDKYAKDNSYTLILDWASRLAKNGDVSASAAGFRFTGSPRTSVSRTARSPTGKPEHNRLGPST